MIIYMVIWDGLVLECLQSMYKPRWSMMKVSSYCKEENYIKSTSGITLLEQFAICVTLNWKLRQSARRIQRTMITLLNSALSSEFSNRRSSISFRRSSFVLAKLFCSSSRVALVNFNWYSKSKMHSSASVFACDKVRWASCFWDCKNYNENWFNNNIRQKQWTAHTEVYSYR